MGDEQQEPPLEGLAYLATRSAEADDEVVLELRATDEGDLAVMAYTGLGELVAACGEFQPWVAVPRPWLPELTSRSGADRVVWNHPLAPEQRHQAPPARAESHGWQADDGWADESDALRRALSDDVIVGEPDIAEEIGQGWPTQVSRRRGR